MSGSRDRLGYARMRDVSSRAIEACEELRRCTDSWLGRPEPPSPAEVHEAARGLTFALSAVSHVAEALVPSGHDEGGAERAAEAQLAAEHISRAVEHLTRVGVLGAERHLGLEEWADPPGASS